MKTLFENMLRSLVRFKVATLLNVIGLSVAFASFMIIMMQVYQELTFDTCYSTSEYLYSVERQRAPGESYTSTMSRPWAEEIIALSPSIRKGAYRNCSSSNKYWAYDPLKGGTSAVQEVVFGASDDFPEVFGLEAVAGNFENFKIGGKAIIAASTAARLFGHNDPIGQNIVTQNILGNDTVEVVAVYRDMPRNASLENGIIKNLGNVDINSSGNFNYQLYLLVNTPQEAEAVAKLATDVAEKMQRSTYHYMHLTHLPDRYFSPWNQEQQKGNINTTYSMIAVAILIVIVAMINFINFSMALIPRRIRNINTRKVLGSGVWGLRFQQLFEALVLNLIALGLGFCIVYIISGTSLASVFSADIHLHSNLPICWITLGIAMLTSLLASIYPALYSTSFPAAMVIKGSFGLSLQGRRLRTVLIGFQYVISLALIIVALSIWRQYTYMRNYDIGLNRENVLVTELSNKMMQHQEALTNRLKENPNIVEVAYSGTRVVDPPMSWGRTYNNQSVNFTCIPVSPNFPAVMGIQIVQGRDFNLDDERKEGTFIFNETAQKRYDLEVGRRMQNHNGLPEGAEIAGIARDFNFRPLHYPVSNIALYVFGRNPWIPLSFCYIKVSGPDVIKTIKDIQKTMLAFDPEAQSRLKIDFFDESIGSMYQKESRQAAQITLFSLLAVLISTLGAFGLILFETQYRRKEIALRKTYGATVGDILQMFNRRYVIIVLICFVLAAPTAFLIIRHWQQNFAYQAPIGVWIFVAALCIVLLITVGTVTLQSYRSATENPSHSFKQE